MKGAIATVLFCLSFILIAGNQAPARPLTKPIVLLDYWWLKDYATNSCVPGFVEGHPKRDLACSNVAGVTSGFEATLEAQLGANSGCHGITFVPFGGGAKTTVDLDDAIKESDWTLIIDFTPGDDRQEWTLVSHDDSTVLKGSGRVGKVASDVCGDILRRGGYLVH